jgi:NADH-quinone oxidoreductase subunit N
MTSIYSIFAVTIISIGLLFFGVFLTHSGKLTSFINFLIVMYFSYYLWLENSGVFMRLDRVDTLDSLAIIQNDSLYFRFFIFYTTLILIIFFIGITDRFFMSKTSIYEFPVLILFLFFGGLFALSLHTFMDIFLGLEIVTLASYVLITFERQNRFSTYAGIQYFILGSLPSAMLLIAFGLFYLQSGSVALQDLDMLFNTITPGSSMIEANDAAFLFNNVVQNTSENIEPSSWYLFNTDVNFFSSSQFNNILESINPENSMVIRGIFFLFFNFFFKLTAAPFHTWAPSVYGQAPLASVAFLSIYSKAMVFFLIYKLMNSFLHMFSFITFTIFMIVGGLSLLTGMRGAFSEKRIKPFFVYSSMGHVGFMLVGLALGTIEGATATFHYLLVYILSSFVMWFTLITMNRTTIKLNQFSKLKEMNPILALFFAFLIFSRSGIPPFAGFFIKLDILAAIMESSHFFVVYFLFFCTVASFFYYLRLIKIRYFDTPDKAISLDNAISFSGIYSSEASVHNVYRFWIISVIRLILATYRFIMQKPMLMIGMEILSSLF